MLFTSRKWIPSLSAWIPLAFDTIVILLTLARCIGPLTHKSPGNTFRTLVKDGALYYRFVNAPLRDIVDIEFPQAFYSALMQLWL